MKLKNKQLAVGVLVICGVLSSMNLYADVVESFPPSHVPCAMVVQNETNADLVFLRDTKEVLVEVYDSRGICVYRKQGSTNTYNRHIMLDTRRWQGRYTIIVKTPTGIQQFLVEYNSSM